MANRILKTFGAVWLGVALSACGVEQDTQASGHVGEDQEPSASPTLEVGEVKAGLVGTGKKIRVISHNLAGGLRYKGELTAVTTIINNIESYQGTDILLLQEVCLNQYNDLKNKLIQNKNWLDVRFAETRPMHPDCPGTGPQGLVTASKWNMSNVNTHELGSNLGTVGTTSRKVFRMLCGDVNVPGYPVSIRACSTHLRSDMTTADSTARLAQATKIKDILGPAITNDKVAVIVAGDFNSEPDKGPAGQLYAPPLPSAEGHFVEGDQVDTNYCSVATGCRAGAGTKCFTEGTTTVDCGRPGNKIDYIFFSASRVGSYSLGTKAAGKSDHLLLRGEAFFNLTDPDNGKPNMQSNYPNDPADAAPEALPGLTWTNYPYNGLQSGTGVFNANITGAPFYTWSCTWDLTTVVPCNNTGSTISVTVGPVYWGGHTLDVSLTNELGTQNFRWSGTFGTANPDLKAFHIRNTKSSGNADATWNFGEPGDIPITGDWDGNGTVTTGVFRNGRWFLNNSTLPGNVDITFDFGQAGDLPVAGDWNGDGRASVAVFRGDRFYLSVDVYTTPWGTHIPVTSTFLFGFPGAQPVAGDWNGDGYDTVGLFSGGMWYLTNTNVTAAAPTHYTFAFGAGGDLPVAGDWNGDGISTVGVFRSSSVYLSDNFSGTLHYAYLYGNSTDTPIAGDFDGNGHWSIGVYR